MMMMMMMTTIMMTMTENDHLEILAVLHSKPRDQLSMKENSKKLAASAITLKLNLSSALVAAGTSTMAVSTPTLITPQLQRNEKPTTHTASFSESHLSPSLTTTTTTTT